MSINKRRIRSLPGFSQHLRNLLRFAQQELSEFGDLRRSKARTRAEDAERACDPTGPFEERRRHCHRALDQLVLADCEAALFDQGELARVFSGIEIDFG